MTDFVFSIRGGEVAAYNPHGWFDTHRPLSGEERHDALVQLVHAIYAEDRAIVAGVMLAAALERRDQ